AALEEQAHQPPEPDAAAVLEHRLGREVTALHALVQRVGLREPRFRVPFAVLHRRLRALLVVHHEVHGQPGAVRPLGIRRIRSIPDEIAVVASHHEFRLLVMSALPRSATAQPGRSERVGAWGPYRGPHVQVVAVVASHHEFRLLVMSALPRSATAQPGRSEREGAWGPYRGP